MDARVEKDDREKTQYILYILTSSGPAGSASQSQHYKVPSRIHKKGP